MHWTWLLDQRSGREDRVSYTDWIYFHHQFVLGFGQH